MNNSIKKAMAMLALLLIAVSGFAQEPAAANAPIEMATGLYQSGKIYVVVSVLAIIMAGIFGYLIALDKKIRKLEKEIRK